VVGLFSEKLTKMGASPSARTKIQTKQRGGKKKNLPQATASSLLQAASSSRENSRRSLQHLYSII
jgi:hypothetical protein